MTSRPTIGAVIQESKVHQHLKLRINEVKKTSEDALSDPSYKPGEEREHQNVYSTTMSPRISFSSGVADPLLPLKLETSYREAPVSSDFEFSVPNHNMVSADKLFFNGKMLPLHANGTKTTTLRDELLAGDRKHVSPSFTKGTSRWRERLGLKRSGFLHRKTGKNAESSLESIDELKVQELTFGEAACPKTKGSKWNNNHRDLDS